MCAQHHRESHSIGDESFARKHSVNLLKEALWLARNSPCPEVRNFTKELKA
jgi:hypothetical protein